MRYAETDQMGVVYHANYFVWFEVGRTELLRAVGLELPRARGRTGSMLPVIEAHCGYPQPARYDDEIEIRTTGHGCCRPCGCEFDYEVVPAGR